jgi:ring-1,2-phenylacetyl-CoA epoxidase subunit PaaE
VSRLIKLVPRSLQPRLEQLRRDVQTVVADLRGRRSPTWLPRSGERYPTSISTSLVTREFEVVEVVRETADAVSLILRDAAGEPLPEVRPGQFFTLLVPVPGEPLPLRRAYSASGDCRQREHVRVTIKRIAGGRASSWLVDHASPGMLLGVLGPSGEFGVALDCEPEPAPRKLVMIAGGSGITPMMAILHSLPTLDPRAELVLIYANRSEPDIVFHAELTTLAGRLGARLTLSLVLEQPPPAWAGSIGRLDEPTLRTILDALALADDPQREFLICGPAGMMEAARATLQARGIADDRIRQETFFQPHLRSDARVQVRDPQPITLMLGTREVGLVVQPGQTLLEAGLAAGLAMPYSCAMGGCAACKVAVEHGEVVMQEPNCLGPRERAEGFVLACIGCPTMPSRIRVS